MDDKVKGNRVAVIGLGLTGVGTLKNLLEEGFDAVGFERNDYLGGLWHYAEDPNLTTVLKSTKANLSKQRGCYQDFPFPDDVPDYPSGEDVAKYIEDYAAHFQLRDRCRLGVRVERLCRSVDGSSWAVQVSDKDTGSRTEVFDKVIVTTGPWTNAFTPQYEGMNAFTGKILHAQAYKSPQQFQGQTVVVVGLSNTAGDVAVDLCGISNKVYVSHRSGGYVASWNLLPARSVQYAAPMINDRFMTLLSSGKLSSLPGIKRFLADGRSLEFTDGTVVPSVDAVIFCTGYHADYSILAPEADPTVFPTPEWDSSPNANGLQYPRLYQGLISTTHPYSLAFIGPFRGHSFNAFGNADLSSQAIAQIWKGNFALPTQSGIEAWCDQNYARSLSQLSVWHLSKAGVQPVQLEKWLNAAAGNGLNEMLGWTSLAAWRFWWQDRKLYRLIMDGIDTAYVYRLFPGRGEKGRKRWDGAREAIFKTNGVPLK